MSLFHPATITCSKCGTQAEIQRNASVNADRRADLRRAILDGSFQAATCRKCGTQLRLPPHLTYLEIKRGTWIAAEPATLLDEWPEVEDQVWRAYSRAFGEDASPAGQSIGAGLRPRLVFGWPALREKLLCADLGLDDITLECLKMAVLRNVDHAPMADQTELRLIRGDAATLELAWFVTLSEQILSGLDVPRDLYDSIAAEPEVWDTVRRRFDGVFLVDLRRFTAGPELAEAAD